VDLVIAVPFALVMEALCIGPLRSGWSGGRAWAVGIGTVLYVGLTAVMRGGQMLQFSVPVAWGVVGLVTLPSVWLEARLAGPEAVAQEDAVETVRAFRPDAE
jgi:hypothetical protein